MPYVLAKLPGATAQDGVGCRVTLDLDLDNRQFMVDSKYVAWVAGGHGVPALHSAKRNVNVDDVVVAATYAQRAHAARGNRVALPG